MSEIVLYDFWGSSAAYRVRIGLKLLGLDWTTHALDVRAGEHKREAYLTKHPQGLVPAIELDGLTMTQSVAILEYLNETRNAGWLPDDPVGRARVRALTYVIAMDIHPICNSAVGRFVDENARGGITMEGWMQRFIPKGLTAYEKMLGDAGQYSHGDSVTLADICLVPQLRNAELWKVDMSGFPRTAEICARLLELDAFRSTHPDALKPEGA